MKKIYKVITAVLCIVLLSATAKAQNEFITEWLIEDNTLVFPAVGNNYTIIWQEVANSNNTDTILNAQSGQTITFPTNGNYLVKASAGTGTLTAFKYTEYYQYPRTLLFVRQWGNNQWTDLTEAFTGCYDMEVTATDAPNLSGVTSLQWMFASCINLKGNPSFNTWNTSTITNMANMFSSASTFNQPLNNWNTENVTNMQSMFYGAENFNQPLNNWNTENVTNMSFMFHRASSFNQPLNNWNTQHVTDMKYMFSQASAFNGDITTWNTSSLNTMENMFASASAFNQNIGNWNTANVTNMVNTFFAAELFNQPIGTWNTGKVTNMAAMFSNATSFNQPIGNWNTANVTQMSSMFMSSSFNQNINTWNTSKVTNMSFMFYGNPVYNQPLDAWNTTAVTDFSSMFANATSFNQPIGTWRLNSALRLNNMFNGATSFNQDISTWNTGNVRYLTGMFSGATSFNQPIGNWNTGRVWELADVLNNATAFNQPLSWYLESANFNSSIGLSNSGMDCNNYSQTLNYWATISGNRYTLILYADGLTYNTQGQAARNTLISTKQWKINGDAYDANCGTTVPVTILSFQLTKNHDAIILNWSTAVENNNKGFYIERSADGNNFEEIHFVAAQGSNSQYSYTDAEPLNGKNYYRLKQTDMNGATTYHEIKSIDFTKNNQETTVYPNPVKGGLLNIKHSENAQIRIINSAGQTVKTLTATGTHTQVNISSLAKGLYFVVINGRSEKILVQ